MPDFAEPLARLINEFKRLPGVGQKSVQRIAFHVLRAGRDDAGHLAQAILDVKDKLGLCSVCNNISDRELCLYCSDAAPPPSSVLWKSRTASLASKPRASSKAATTCCTARSRRFAAL